MFENKEEALPWDISNIFTDENDDSIAEQVAEFFNRISLEYEPIPNPLVVMANAEPDLILEQYIVSSRLKTFKKTKSQVKGDIPPVLVDLMADILAIPLSYIFNLTLNTISWPKLWSLETVTAIPKNFAPSCLGELINLSCTPLFSKVLESFVLARLKEDVSLSTQQYGGIKGISTEHFLVDTWNSLLNALEEEGSAANLISVDFEKALIG